MSESEHYGNQSTQHNDARRSLLHRPAVAVDALVVAATMLTLIRAALAIHAHHGTGTIHNIRMVLRSARTRLQVASFVGFYVPSQFDEWKNTLLQETSPFTWDDKRMNIVFLKRKFVVDLRVSHCCNFGLCMSLR